MNILLDMDGVIVDFVSAAIAACGSGLDHDMITDRDMAKCIGLSKRDFWKAVDATEGFWENLDAYPWADQVVSLVDRTGFNWFLCSSPSWSSESVYGKREWMKKQFGSDFNRYVLTPHKHLLSAPGNVLIDDSEPNCQKFAQPSLLTSGSAILFPQPWNSAWNHDEDIDRVKYLEHCFQQTGLLPSAEAEYV